jgi:hypothetical protein
MEEGREGGREKGRDREVMCVDEGEKEDGGCATPGVSLGAAPR